VVSNATAATTLAQTENHDRFAKNAEAKLADQLLHFFDRLDWIIYAWVACLIWTFIGLRTLEFVVGYPRDTFKSRLITFGPVSCISLLPLIFSMLLLLAIAVPILGWAFDPRRLWPSLPILAVVWVTSYFSKRPWLIAAPDRGLY
jgi:Enoyl-(Acyl carrier protein) reductase